MIHFSNQELAEMHHVSVRTVRNWIDAAREGKLDLTLETVGQRHYIANTSKNALIINDLVHKGKKYRPHRSQKTVMPQSKFYDLYTQEQLYDLVANLEIHREIPIQYNYFGDGAHNWDSYAERLVGEESPNILKATVELLESNKYYLDSLLETYSQINVIDIGVGNALPVKQFLAHLNTTGKFGRYIAIDMSSEMLDIAEKNVTKWFGDSIQFERHELDITHDRFGYLLSEEYIKTDSKDTCNIFLFLGGTINNFKKPSTVLEVLHDSMGTNDFLIHSQKLDSPVSQRFFDFYPAQPNGSLLAPYHGYIFDLLNINESLYDVDMGYSDKLRERYVSVILKVALDIRFMFNGGERTIAFNKGDTIQLWRARQSSVLEVVKLLSDNDFYTLHFSQTSSRQYVLSVSTIKQIQK